MYIFDSDVVSSTGKDDEIYSCFFIIISTHCISNLKLHFIKQYITVDNSYILLYTVYRTGGTYEYYYKPFKHGSYI